MTTAVHGASGRFAARIAVGLALLWVLGFVAIAIARLGHPFELEWMGGAFVDQVCRVLDGEALYVAPTADYVPFLYAPLYFYAAAGMALVTGEGFLPLRLVSVLATLATLVMLGRWIARRTGSTPAGFVAAGVYAGSYFVVDTWYDTARSDSLFVALAVASLVVLDRGTRRASAITAGVLLVVAYHTKQTALLLAPAFAVGAWLQHGRARGLWFAASFASVFAVTFLALDALHDGWFAYYTWTLPRRHEFVAPLALGAMWIDLRPLWPALVVGGIALVVHARRGAVRDALAIAAWSGGLLAAALSSRAHVGGAVNVLMPGLVGIAALSGIAWSVLATGPGRLATLARGVLVAQLLALAVDFPDQDTGGPLRPIDPLRAIPTAADRAAGERLVTMLREADGDVLVPFHGYLPRLAGKRPGAHVMALIDVERSGEPALWDRLHVEFLESARTRHAALVLLDPLAPEEDKPPERRLGRLVYPGYAIEPLSWPDDATFMPVVGLRTRPVFVARRLP